MRWGLVKFYFFLYHALFKKIQIYQSTLFYNMPGAPVSNPMEDRLKFSATKQISSGPVMQKHRELEDKLERSRRLVCADIQSLRKNTMNCNHDSIDSNFTVGVLFIYLLTKKTSYSPNFRKLI